MCGRHQTFDDAELVVHNLDEGREAVFRARGIGDDVVVRRVFVFVDTQYKHGCVGGGSRDDNRFRIAFEVRGGRSLVVKTPCITGMHKHDLIGGGSPNRKRVRTHSRLYDALDAVLTPWNIQKAPPGKVGGGLAVGDELAVLGLDGTLKWPWVGSYLNMYAYTCQSDLVCFLLICNI